MNPAALIPAPDSIQIPWGWFQFFLMLTFILHLLCMNVMVGGAVISLVGALRNPGSPPPLSREISSKLPYAIAFTVNFGVAPLLFLQVLYGQFMYASSVLMAVYWLSVVGLLICAYYCAYIYDFRFDALKENRARLIGLVVFMFLVVAFLFSNNMTLMLNPQAWTAYFDRPTGTLLNLADPTLVPRWLHFMTASIAVGGLAIAVLHRVKGWRDHEDHQAAIHHGLRWFTYGTMAQILVGIWFLFALPADIRRLFLAGSALHSLLFLVGIGCALLALLLGFARSLWPTTFAAMATVVTMVLMRDLVRRAYLAPYFSPADLVVVPQYSPFLLFLLVLAVGIGVIVYMLKLAWQVGREEGI